MSRFTEMVSQDMPQYGKLSGWLWIRQMLIFLLISKNYETLDSKYQEMVRQTDKLFRQSSIQ